MRCALIELELHRRLLCERLLAAHTDDPLPEALADELTWLAAGVREEATAMEAAVRRLRRRTPAASADTGREETGDVAHRQCDAAQGASRAGEGEDGEVVTRKVRACGSARAACGDTACCRYMRRCLQHSCCGDRPLRRSRWLGRGLTPPMQPADRRNGV